MLPTPTGAPSDGSTPALRVMVPVMPVGTLESVTVPGGRQNRAPEQLSPVVLLTLNCALFSAITVKTVGWPVMIWLEAFKFEVSQNKSGIVLDDGECDGGRSRDFVVARVAVVGSAHRMGTHAEGRVVLSVVFGIHHPRY